MNCEHPKLLNSNHLPLRIPLKPHCRLYRGIMEKKMETTIWDSPKIRGTFLGIPIVRTIMFLGPILGSPYFGKLPYRVYPKP